MRHGSESAFGIFHKRCDTPKWGRRPYFFIERRRDTAGRARPIDVENNDVEREDYLSTWWGGANYSGWNESAHALGYEEECWMEETNLEIFQMQSQWGKLKHVLGAGKHRVREAKLRRSWRHAKAGPRERTR